MTNEQRMLDIERIQIGDKSYRRFIPFPGPVTDGTLRCIRCGQIDEAAYHDDDICAASLKAQSTDTSEGQKI